jgi:hypothetical protein
MRQATYGNGSDFGEVGTEDLYLIQSTDCHIGKRAIRVGDDIYVIGDRPCVERRKKRKGRAAGANFHLTLPIQTQTAQGVA